MEIAQTLKKSLIRHLTLPAPIILSEETQISEGIRKMQDMRASCVLVEKNGKLVGIVTERDILVKYMGNPSETYFTLKDLMTADLVTLSPDASLDEAICVMTEGGYRHIPLVDSGSQILGVVAVRHIVTYIAEHFPVEVFNLPPRLEQMMNSPEGA